MNISVSNLPGKKPQKSSKNKTPYAISGKDYQQYCLKIEEEKMKNLMEKEDRKRQREEKKNEKAKLKKRKTGNDSINEKKKKDKNGKDL